MSNYGNNLIAAINGDFNYLAHYGVTGMHPRVHIFGKYQNQAVYARGNPKYGAVAKRSFGKKIKDKFDDIKQKRADAKQAKIAAETRKKAEAAAFQEMKPDFVSLRKGIKNMDAQTLNKEAERLRAERNYTQALIDNINKTQEYKNILDAPEKAKQKAFQERMNKIWDATAGIRKDTMKIAGNIVKSSLYDAIAAEYGPEKANRIMNGLVQVPKNNQGGGNQNNQGGNGNRNQNQGGNSQPGISAFLNNASSEASSQYVIAQAQLLREQARDMRQARKEAKRQGRQGNTPNNNSSPNNNPPQSNSSGGNGNQGGNRRNNRGNQGGNASGGGSTGS